MSTRLFFLLFLLSLTAIGQKTGNGKDGNKEIGGVVNAYAYLMEDAKRCDDLLQVNDGSLFSAGDLVLIIQMQGALINAMNDSGYGAVADPGNSGYNELAEVKQVDGNSITLGFALIRNYDAGFHVQVIRVPQFGQCKITSALTCPSWNGKTGGVVVIDASKISFLGNIQTTGKGFRGGEVENGNHVFTLAYEYSVEPDPTYFSKKGEGIAGFGTGSLVAGRGAPANGGGGGNIHTTGGGGGAAWGSGGDGGWGYPVDTSKNERIVFGTGGRPLSSLGETGRLHLGGGGGAGHEHFGNGTSGATGGGLVILLCDTLEGNGYKIFVGGDNSAASGAWGDGAGGAGGGGTVLIQANFVSTPLFVFSTGGQGGSSVMKGFGPGGGGGGGIVKLKSLSVPDSIFISIAGGNGGKAGGQFYGAGDGSEGVIVLNSSIVKNEAYQAVHAAFDLSPFILKKGNEYSVSGSSILFKNMSTGGNFSFWEFGDGVTDTIKDPGHTYRSEGIFIIVLVESNSTCSDTAVATLINSFELPNIFTPNGDNINDLFPGFTIEETRKFIIFNRWGEEVFRAENRLTGWNGRNKVNIPVPEGTYFYIIEYGSAAEEKKIRRGDILLLR